MYNGAIEMTATFIYIYLYRYISNVTFKNYCYYHKNLFCEIK